MAKQLDIYRDWLGISESARPLNHYQLLRLAPFEDDPAKVREHYRKMNGHVRRFQTGDYAKQSQELLNELARAMLCLTDSRRKAEYDATLGRKAQQSGRRSSLEELLLQRKTIDANQLDKARKFANSVGVDIQDALIQQRLAPADVVMTSYAESIGMPFLDLTDFTLDPALLRLMPATIARQHSCSPVMVDDNQILVATPHLIDPIVEDELRLRLGKIVRQVLCTPQQIHSVIQQYFPKEAVAAELATKGVGGGSPRPVPVVAGDDEATPAAPVAAPEEREAADQSAQKIALGGGFGVYAVVQALYQFGYLGQTTSVVAVNAMGLGGGALVGGLIWLVVRPRR